ncbi:MAG: hypothetical protein NTZ35_00165 [Ignavibacteriales bacterium]|nr:hypothetical protein [Ignavibacteriales bacterium]
MSYLLDPPFALGQTLGVSSLTSTEGASWVGAVKSFPDVNPITGQIRSGRTKTCIAVRNTSGVALLPKRVGKFAVAAGTALFSTVDGYSLVANDEFVGVVDEHLPSSGVAANDVFWLTVKGPTEILGALSGTAIAVGDHLVAIVAATSGATTAGRVTPMPQATLITTNGAGNNAFGVLGYAVSAGTTTGTAVLAFIDCKAS